MSHNVLDMGVLRQNVVSRYIHRNCGFALQSQVQHPQSKLKQSFKS